MKTVQFKTNINCGGCIAKATPTLNEVVGDEDFVAAHCKERAEICAAEDKTGNTAIGRRNDAVHATRLIADLDAEPRGHVKASIFIHSHAAHTGVIFGVRLMQVVIPLLELQRTVEPDLK